MTAVGRGRIGKQQTRTAMIRTRIPTRVPVRCSFATFANVPSKNALVRRGRAAAPSRHNPTTMMSASGLSSTISRSTGGSRREDHLGAWPRPSERVRVTRSQKTLVSPIQTIIIWRFGENECRSRRWLGSPDYALRRLTPITMRPPIPPSLPRRRRSIPNRFRALLRNGRYAAMWRSANYRRGLVCFEVGINPTEEQALQPACFAFSQAVETLSIR